jgi:hypothetical protein
MNEETIYRRKGKKLAIYRSWSGMYWPNINGTLLSCDGDVIRSTQHFAEFTNRDAALMFCRSIADQQQTPEEREAVLKEAGWE